MKNPFIVGDNVYLRNLAEQDLNESYHSWLNDQEVNTGNSHAIFPTSFESMKAYYNSIIGSTDKIILAIIAKDKDVHIGNISLQNINWIYRSAEFAILLGDKSYWGKGVGYEAVRLIINHGFKQLNLNRIYCGTFDNNIGMQKIAEKLGMQQEGSRRDAVYKNGTYYSILEYGILRSEFNIF